MGNQLILVEKLKIIKKNPLEFDICLADVWEVMSIISLWKKIKKNQEKKLIFKFWSPLRITDLFSRGNVKDLK